MCGITGIFAFNTAGRLHMINLAKAMHSMDHRGPDAFGTYFEEHVALGHRRLSIIDLSEEANQPMKEASSRYSIVYNGEIYNYEILRSDLKKAGITFQTDSDTEVVLQSYIHWGSDCLSKFNGFFALAIYDKLEDQLFIARDRFGIKPLYYLFDEDKFIFASEMQAMIHFGLDKKLDTVSLHTYFQLNYIPAPETILQPVKTLLPGHFAMIGKKSFKQEKYYSISYSPSNLNPKNLTYDDQKEKLKSLLEASVQDRLVSDVPLGTFLSGGIDSSVISLLAKRHKEDLHTFSIGYTDEPFFDETEYANLVAKKIDSNHTVFSLSKDEIEDQLDDILKRIDQPFADSSALPVYILCKKTKEHITVALSGDGADELFSGYNKHSAFLQASESDVKNTIAKNFHFLASLLPQSRQTKITNTIRQFNRYGKALNLTPQERYWRWASLGSPKLAMHLLSKDLQGDFDHDEFNDRKHSILNTITNSKDLNEVLLTDMQLVLPNDMLKKVDLMSMANGLEVRVPFLDHRIVEFIFSLPQDSKINGQIRKRILQDAFRDLLPTELYNRPKHGFEVPLLRWFRGSLKSKINGEWLNEDFIRTQGIFDLKAIKKLKRQLFSWNPGDVHAQIWALIVFQSWWKRHFE